MKYIILIMFIAVSVQAEKYATVFQDASVSAEGQIMLRANIQNAMGRPEPRAYTNNPLWRLKADTNILGYADCKRIDGFGQKNLRNVTIAQFEAIITKDLKNPDKQKIKVMSREDLKADYEPVETEL